MLLALLLVIIIFLGGIATALSILNIRLFQELHRKENALTVAYAVQSQTEAEAETVAGLLMEEMQGVAHLAVPLTAEAHWGRNWLEAKG